MFTRGGYLVEKPLSACRHWRSRCIVLMALLASTFPMTETLQRSSGATIEFTVSQPVAAESGEVSPRYQCRRAPTSLVVDGDLSDWADIPHVALYEAAQVHNVGADWTGPLDCSGTMRMCFDGDWLYLAFRTTDDVYHQGYTGRGSWMNDSVRFAFDPMSQRGSDGYGPYGQEFYVSLTKRGPLLWRNHGGRTGPVESARLGLMLRKDGSGVSYELAIPWTELNPLIPIARQHFGFSFAINDSDGARLKSRLEWTGGFGDPRDPSAFGQVTLDYGPPEDKRTELLVACRVPAVADQGSLRFDVACFAANQTEIDVATTLTAAGEAVAGSRTTLHAPEGVSHHLLAYKVTDLADGTYEGTIAVEMAEGQVLKHQFTYERLMTAPIRAGLARTRHKEATLADELSLLHEIHEPSLAYRLFPRC